MGLVLFGIPGLVLAAAILYAYNVTRRAKRPLAVWRFTGIVVIVELLLAAAGGALGVFSNSVLNPGDDRLDMYGAVVAISGALVAPFVGLVAFVLGAAFEQARRDRQSPYACQKCGYDLRGAASDRCSECGEPIPPRDASPREE